MGTITFRYLNKEVLVAMLAFTVVLMVIMVTGRLNRYLIDASRGAVNPQILFWLIWYRLPEFLQLILPMGLFLGILLGLGRLYVDNEMTVLLACGLSIPQIIVKLLGSVIAVTMIVSVLSLWVTPQSNSKTDMLWKSQGNNSMKLESLVPGRFQSQANNTRVAYTETLSADKQQLGNVFIAQTSKPKKKSEAKDKTNQTLMIIVAESATQKIKESSGDRFLILNNGYRYDGRPGHLDYRVMQFSSYGVKITDGEDTTSVTAQSVKTTRELWRSHSAKDNAELQWRLSLPILVPIVMLLAVALSRVRPRQGRFIKLMPALCLYIVYILLLIGMQSALRSQAVPFVVGLWSVHLLFLVLALVLLKQDQLMRYWHQRRVND